MIYHDPDILKRMYGYMDDVLQERVEVGELTTLYVKRQAEDLARASRGEIVGADKEKYVFDELKVEKTVNFMQLFDVLSGQNPDAAIRLMPWQVLFMGSLFGWVTDDERQLRRFRTAYLSMARQNGKTLMGALIALRCFILDREGMSMVYTGAADMEQAMIPYNRIKHMLVRRRDVMAEFGISVYNSLTKGIQKNDGGELRPLAKDMRGNLDGKSVQCAILDELHAHKKRDTWDSMEKGTQARAQPLIVGLTTAGDDVSGLAKKQHDYACKILRGDQQDDTYLACIYATDNGLVQHKKIYDEKAWRQACPSYDVIKPKGTYIRLSKQAMDDPGARHSFHTKMLNVWGTSSIGWMNMVRWDQCRSKEPLEWEFFETGTVHLGMDLSSMNDLSAVAFTKKEGDKFYAKVSYWVPENAAKDKRRFWYEEFMNKKMLNICPGDTIDYDMIEGFILKFHKKARCHISKVACDPYQAAATINRLQKAGVKMAKFHQSVTYYHYPAGGLLKAVLDGDYVHDGNEVTTWCFGNAIAKYGKDDMIMPAKDPNKKDQMVDGAQASIMSFYGAITEHKNVMTEGWFGSMLPKDRKRREKRS